MENLVFAPYIDWVKKDPSRPAVTDLTQTWTYEELFKKASQITASLNSFSNQEINQVAILGNKNNNSVAGILGILFGGRTYCPLDVSLPASRLDKIFSILSPLGLILTGLTPFLKNALSNLKEKPAFILDLGGDLPDNILEGVKRLKLSQFDYSIKHNLKNPAYIIFTSGSTGMPKGVCISHKAASAALKMFQDHVCIQENDRVCNQVSLCFDLSVFDIFGGLTQGASVYLAPSALSSVPDRLVQYMMEKSVTSIFTVPSTIKYLIENSSKSLGDSALKNLLFSGEPLSFALLEKIESFFPKPINLWNLYGATEVPYVLAEKILNKNSLNNFSLKGTEVEVHVDDSGELMVRSPAMLLGYRTEGSRQFQSPLKEGNWYSTGDCASIDSQGKVTIHGRKDRQIKIQGHRIELDEIEYELETFEEIKEGAVVFCKDKKKLIAFIVLNSNDDPLTHLSSIKEQCQISLPFIMCPHDYYVLPQIPRTLSSKKDRVSLVENIKSFEKDFCKMD